MTGRTGPHNTDPAPGPGPVRGSGSGTGTHGAASVVVCGRTLEHVRRSAQAALALLSEADRPPAARMRPRSATLDALTAAREPYPAALREAVQGLRAAGVSGPTSTRLARSGPVIRETASSLTASRRPHAQCCDGVSGIGAAVDMTGFPRLRPDHREFAHELVRKRVQKWKIGSWTDSSRSNRHLRPASTSPVS